MFEHALSYYWKHPSPYAGLWLIFVAEAWLINRTIDSLLWGLIAVFFLFGCCLLLKVDWTNKDYLICDLTLLVISALYTSAMVDYPIQWLKDSLLALVLFGGYYLYTHYYQLLKEG